MWFILFLLTLCITRAAVAGLGAGKLHRVHAWVSWEIYRLRTDETFSCFKSIKIVYLLYCKCINKRDENMSKTAVIQARIDPEIKKEAQKILRALNISLSEAISLYLTQVTLHKGIPFEIKIPNETTLAAIASAETGKELKQVDSVEHLFEDLE